MKEIYRFTLNKKESVEEVDITFNDKKEEIKTTRKVEKEVPHVFVLKRPNRSINDDTEIFRAATESELIRRGVISATLLQKRLLNDGGILTEEEKKEYDVLRENFVVKQTEYSELSKIEDKDKTPEQTKKSEELLQELSEIIKRINELDSASSNLYNRTAEALARNKTILWLTLMLSAEEKDGKLVPVFGEGDYEKKLKVYDSMEEKEDEFEYSLIQKLQFITGLYYMGRASTKDEFDSMLKLYDNQSVLGNL